VTNANWLEPVPQLLFRRSAWPNKAGQLKTVECHATNKRAKEREK
jgi:hypothetical protein